MEISRDGYSERRIYLRSCKACGATQYFGEGLGGWKCPKCKGYFRDHLPLPTDPPHLYLSSKVEPKKKILDKPR